VVTGQSKLKLLFATTGASSVQEQLALKNALLKTFGGSSETVPLTLNDFLTVLNAYSREVHRHLDPCECAAVCGRGTFVPVLCGI
jgi:hypothetical protein